MTLQDSLTDLANAAATRVTTAPETSASEAVELFSVFEARLQHHFKRGPFSRKLKAKLLDAGRDDLATRLYDYYLAVNVLKHGKGASYRQLLQTPSAVISLTDETAEPLIDVQAAGFFDGLVACILEARDFLEHA